MRTMNALKWASKVFISVVIALELFIPLALSTPVQAAPNPIDLVLGGEGATSWDVTNIKPGDSGTKTVTLHNAGTVDGYVSIWVSDIVSINATTPGDFADHLMLNISVNDLATNLSLPVRIRDFPPSASSSYYVRINNLSAGATSTLLWNWELPSQTGNDIQGKGVSFSINYMLAEFPPPQTGGGATPPQLAVLPPPERVLGTLIGDKISEIKLGGGGEVLEDIRLADSTGNFVFFLNKGVKISGLDGIKLDRIDFNTVEKTITEKQRIEELVDLPENMVVLSPTYRITGTSAGKEVSSIIFDPRVIITINYNPKDLPENALPPFVVNFTEGGKIVHLEAPPDSVFELGKAKCVATHASYFAVLAELAPPPQPLPAYFKASGLKINPIQVRPGRPVSISVDITNDGDVAGTYELYLVIDGIIRSVKEVSIEPRSTTTVKFEASNLAAGEHQVKIAGLNGKFQVTSMAVVPEREPVDWLLLDLSVVGLIVVGLLLTYLVVRRSRQAQDKKI